MPGLGKLFSNCVALLNHMTEEEVIILNIKKQKVCLLLQKVCEKA